MTQPFADALTWMPKSRALSATLTRAHDVARAQGHQDVLLEHLLQSLIEDPDASAVLLACNVDLLNLNDAVSQHLNKQPVAGSSSPQASPGLLLILEYAAAAARQSKRSEVNGAIVLAAMAGEGKSDAARMLKAAGLKFEDTIQALKKAPQPRSTASEPVQPVAGLRPPALPPAAPQPLAPPLQPLAAPPSSVAPSDPRPVALETAKVPPETPAPQIGQVTAVAAVATPPSEFGAGLATLTRTQPASGLSAPSQSNADEDPLTTARRRVAALRSGSGASGETARGAPVLAHAVPEPPALAVGMSPPALVPAAAAAAATVPEIAQATTWAPVPQQMPIASNVRPMRMPPPIPQLPGRPPAVSRPAHPQNLSSFPSSAPWSGPAGDTAELLHPEADAETLLPQKGAQVIIGEPIDPTRLSEGFPHKMLERVPSTVEIRISRAAVLATSAAMRAGVRDSRDTALVRAVSLRLKAPNGGVFVESASPETQWFESRSAQRDEDEVRWRWVVTPQSSGTKALQISLSMRTVAHDGTVIDTALPEHLVSVRVGSNYREAMRRLGRAFIALSAGVAITLIATGGFASLFGKVFK